LLASACGIAAIALYYLAGKLGRIGNFLWLGLCQAVIAMPIALLILLSALHAVDPNLERAADARRSPHLHPRARAKAIALPIEALPPVTSAVFPLICRSMK